MEFIYFLTYIGRNALTLAPRTDRSYNLRSIQLLLTNSEMQQNVQHIDIPFDELKIFIAGKEEIYQDIIIESKTCPYVSTSAQYARQCALGEALPQSQYIHHCQILLALQVRRQEIFDPPHRYQGNFQKHRAPRDGTTHRRRLRQRPNISILRR